MSRRVAVALVHHPVLGREGEILTTTLTNLDVHDIARSARTYGLAAFYVVHPLESQQLVAARIVEHWVEGAGGRRIPDRAEALRVLRVVPTIEAAAADFSREAGEVELWTTAARPSGDTTSYAAARPLLEREGPPVLILFGTGWGLAPAVLQSATRRLEPIAAARDAGFNHLSVRAACAITLDRLFG
ncbi:MAG: RNA methyltransferase [Myxococcales bacterium]|nr:RNA methyltransferase [Myxococcales bacterium]